MLFDLSATAPGIAYKLLAATVMPRPIAWVVTQGAGGGINAAPFSFFNVMGHEPPTVALGITPNAAGGLKHTAKNILGSREFVVNLVPERLAGAMNLTSIDAPEGVDELALAGLASTPSARVAPPRIAESPVALECRMLHGIETGPAQMVFIGEVLAVHIAEDCVKDAARGHVDTPRLDLIGRSYGTDYVRSHDIFRLERPRWRDYTGGD